MNKIYLVIAFALVFSLVFVSAEKTIPDVMQGTCANLWQTCDNCTFVNVSSVVVQGVGNILTGELSLSNTATGYFNTSFCDTTRLGEYTYNTYGNLNGVIVSEPVTFQVTPTGITQYSILNNPILIILLVISILFLILALYTKNYPMGFISGVMFIISGIYTMIYGFNNYADDYSRTVGLVLIALGFIFMLASGYEWIADNKDEGSEIVSGGEEDEFKD